MLVKKYDGEFPMRFYAEILNYLDMDVDEFFEKQREKFSKKQKKLFKFCFFFI